MAAKNRYPVSTVSTPKAVDLRFKFRPNFTSPVSSTYIKPNRGITSITRTGTGIWSVNLDATYNSIAAFASRQGSNTDCKVEVENCSDVVSGYTSNSVVQLRHDIAGTASDVVSASTNWIHVYLACSDSDVGM